MKSAGDKFPHYHFTATELIPPGKHEAIRQAIEFILNNEPTDITMGGYTFRFQEVPISLK